MALRYPDSNLGKADQDLSSRFGHRRSDGYPSRKERIK
jgi:hypothetical protein